MKKRILKEMPEKWIPKTGILECAVCGKALDMWDEFFAEPASSNPNEHICIDCFLKQK